MVSAQKVSSKAYQVMLDALLEHPVKEITVDSLKGSSSKPILFDARSPDEYRISHIEGARFIGYEGFNLEKLPQDLSTLDTIVVYCAVGYRSEKLAEQLKEAGYKNVLNLYGGIFEWVNQDGPLVNSKGQQTEQIHPYNWLWGQWLQKGKKSTR